MECEAYSSGVAPENRTGMKCLPHLPCLPREIPKGYLTGVGQDDRTGVECFAYTIGAYHIFPGLQLYLPTFLITETTLSRSFSIISTTRVSEE